MLAWLAVPLVLDQGAHDDAALLAHAAGDGGVVGRRVVEVAGAAGGQLHLGRGGWRRRGRRCGRDGVGRRRAGAACAGGDRDRFGRRFGRDRGGLRRRCARRLWGGRCRRLWLGRRGRCGLRGRRRGRWRGGDFRLGRLDPVGHHDHRFSRFPGRAHQAACSAHRARPWAQTTVRAMGSRRGGMAGGLGPGRDPVAAKGAAAAWARDIV